MKKQPVLEILHDNYYYDVTDWVKKHPGGGVIEFYTQNGEDATIAIKQFHLRSEKKVASIMKFLRRRPAEKKYSEQVISEFEPKRNYKILTDDFVRLHEELLKEGMFTPSIFNTALRIFEIIFLLSFGLYLTPSENIYLKIVGLFCVAFYGSRGGFLMHEAGHRSLTGNIKIDKIIQNATSGLCMGMSASFWSSQHNRHHAMPQRLNHDVDLETMPLVAFNTKVVRNRESGKSFFIQNQAYLFFLIDTYLIGLLFKLYTHPRYALHKGCYGQLLLMTMHYSLIYFIGIWMYLICVWLASFHMLGTFALSHSHLPVTSESRHWVEFGLEHTMNTNSSPFEDWWTGYLNYQIEHHLFPTIPNFRLVNVAPRVRALAAKHNIPYHCVSYSEAVIRNVKNLYQVSKELEK